MNSMYNHTDINVLGRYIHNTSGSQKYSVWHIGKCGYHNVATYYLFTASGDKKLWMKSHEIAESCLYTNLTQFCFER